MFFEYALEPEALSSWERVRYFLERFGPAHGRFLAQYPGRWKRRVFEALDAAPALAKSRAVEKLNAMNRAAFSPRSCGPYDPTRPWLANAQDEHGRRAFRAIIAEGCGGAPHLLDASTVDDSHDLWRVPNGVMIARDSRAVASAVELLVAASTTVVLIDPYFRAEDRSKTAPLVELCRPLAGRAVEIHVHMSVERCPYTFAEQKAKERLPGILPRGVRVTLSCWDSRTGGARFHNRYLITDIGGVQFGDGIEQGAPGEQDRMSIMGEIDRRAVWDLFYGAAPGFDPAGPPISVMGVR